MNLKSLLVLSLGLFFNGCGGSAETPKDPNYVSATTPQTYALVVGTVKDELGSALGDVNVSGLSQESVTNVQGYFALSHLPENDRAAISFNKDGYVFQSKTVHTRIGESSFLDVVMTRKSAEGTFNASRGVQASNGGATVNIPAGGLVTADGAIYNGEAKISITVFDPSTKPGHDIFPGRFEGVQKNGEVIPIRSLGFIDVTPTTADGQPLQLKPGTFANVVIPVPANLLASAPATIPLWYFNPVDGQWHEEGSAQLDNNVYRGRIPHFSIWNCDVGLRRAFVTGRVLDCGEEGLPVRGARVTIQNVRAGWSSGEDSTPENGRFNIPVNASEAVTLVAAKGGQTSQPPLAFTAPGENQTVDVGDVCIGVPKIQIVLKWEKNPEDLDAHLTIPTTGTRDHVYYSNRNGESAKLDTDDTNGFGPEMISVFKLYDGIYRYSVHHYRGTGTLSNAGAHVYMTVDKLGIFEMTPPADAKGTGDVWNLWDIKVSGKKVIELIPLMNFKNEKTASDLSAFSP